MPCAEIWHGLKVHTEYLGEDLEHPKHDMVDLKIFRYCSAVDRILMLALDVCKI